MKKITVFLNKKPFELEIDDSKLPWIVKVNEKTYEVRVEREKPSRELPVPLRPTLRPTKEVERGEEGDIFAPLPGVVLSLKVKVGDFIEKGELLCILEAMKMENRILAPKRGKIKKINVKEGQSVEYGELLFSIE
ncbi:MAG: acetyl-CoA carboxylase biotin carboxyl carrier protein [Candidatus Methanofastidiosia archaeon]